MRLRRTPHKSLKQEALLRTIPSWDDIRFLLAIHRAGSLSAAAAPLGVTQPTCGRRLAALERSLGLRLFDRTPEGLQITSEGATLLDAATAMEQSALDLALRAAVKDRDLEGVVRISTTEIFACSFLVRALPQVRARYPGLRMELVLSNAETDLLKRDADIAFRFRPEGMRPTPAALVARKLGNEPFLLYAGEAYLDRCGLPQDPNHLAGHDVVVYAGPHPAAAWCAIAFQDAKVVLSAASMQVTGAAINTGMGLGVLPRRAARLYPSIRPVSPIVAHGTGWLVLHPDLQNVPRIRVVVDFLAGLFHNEAGME